MGVGTESQFCQRFAESLSISEPWFPLLQKQMDDNNHSLADSVK